MGRLLLINGLPGSGKSTLAGRYVSEHPLSLCLDVDVVRGLLGGWLEQPGTAGLLARRLALAMARVSLSEGRDVVVPQFLARLAFIVELEAVAEECGAEFTALPQVNWQEGRDVCQCVEAFRNLGAFALALGRALRRSLVTLLRGWLR